MLHTYYYKRIVQRQVLSYFANSINWFLRVNQSFVANRRKTNFSLIRTAFVRETWFTFQWPYATFWHNVLFCISILSIATVYYYINGMYWLYNTLYAFKTVKKFIYLNGDNFISSCRCLAIVIEWLIREQTKYALREVRTWILNF